MSANVNLLFFPTSSIAYGLSASIRCSFFFFFTWSTYFKNLRWPKIEKPFFLKKPVILSDIFRLAIFSYSKTHLWTVDSSIPKIEWNRMIIVEVLILLSEKSRFLEFGEKWAKMAIFEHFFDFSKINSLSIFNSLRQDSCYPRYFCSSFRITYF